MASLVIHNLFVLSVVTAQQPSNSYVAALQVERTLRPRGHGHSGEGSRRGRGKSNRTVRKGKLIAPLPPATKSPSYTVGGLRGRRKARRAEREQQCSAIASLAEAAALVEGAGAQAGELKEISCQSISGHYQAAQDVNMAEEGEKNPCQLAPVLDDTSRRSRKRGKEPDSFPGKERWKRGRLGQAAIHSNVFPAPVGPTSLDQQSHTEAAPDPSNPEEQMPCTSADNQAQEAGAVEKDSAFVGKDELGFSCNVAPLSIATDTKPSLKPHLAGSHIGQQTVSEAALHMGGLSECISQPVMQTEKPNSESCDINGVTEAGESANTTASQLGKAGRGPLSTQERLMRKEEAKLAKRDGYSYGEWIARSSSSFLADQTSNILEAVTLESFLENVTEVMH